MFESFGLLNDIFPFPSILDAGYPVFNHVFNLLVLSFYRISTVFLSFF